jgi:hypothetical protein
MESILYNMSQVLGITIIHSLWQGMLVYIVMRVIFAAAPSLAAVKRYRLSLFAMVLVAVLFMYTLFIEINAYNWVSLKPGALTTLIPGFDLLIYSHSGPAYFNRLSSYMPYICALYFAGLIMNVLKLSREWSKIIRIKKSLIMAGQMQQFINSFSKKLDITKHIQLKFSELVDVPCVIGYIKPLILLPVSLSLHLSACEIEAILLHELSHIKRNDYLINLLQQIISAMLFFNPFSLLINRTINQERENCCDDLVIEKTGKPLIYAKALLKLEQGRSHNMQLALAITGNKFHLLNRIERIMKTKKTIGSIRHLFIALLLFAGGIGCIAWFNPGNAKMKVSKNSKPDQHNRLSAFSTPDSDEYIHIEDTIKHKHKSNAIAKNKAEVKKHYKAAKELTPKAKKEFFEQYLGMDTTFSDSLTKFCRSPEWKAQMDAMRKQGEEIRKKFDSPQWKAQMLAMREQGEEMRKKFDSPEWKAQMDAMRKQGEEMRKKFDSPEWKAQMDAMRKQGEEMRKKFDSPEWKAQMDAMRKQGEEMRKKFDSPEWKAQVDAMRKQGEEMRKKFDSPQWKKQKEEWKKMKGENWILKDPTGTHTFTPDKTAKKDTL